MVFLSIWLRKNLSKMKNFKKFMIFRKWLELAEMQKDTNVSIKNSDIRFDKKTRQKLRSPLTVGEKVLVLAKRLRKKDMSSNLYKSMTENVSFFNREEIFIVRKVLLKENSYNYWISKMADSEIINKRFLQQELFALKNQFHYGSDIYLL